MASIGKDLGTIRKHLGYELDDVYQSTRISMEILKRIENDSLFSDPNENIIYVRSFARTYARALKIPDNLILKSLDQYETGIYNGTLLESYPKLGKKKPSLSSKSENPGDDSVKGEDDTKGKEDQAPDSQPAHPLFEENNIKPRPATKPESKSVPVPPPVESVNWAKLGHKFSPIERSTPVWIIGAVIILIIALTIFYFIYNSDLLSSNDVSQANITEQPAAAAPGGGELSLNLNDQSGMQGVETDAASALDDVLYLTLYAAYDRLGPVRVWSDLKPRIDPYWMESGTAYAFEFRDSIRISGSYNDMLLFLNGHRIDNFLQLYYNQDVAAVELTRDVFTPESRWAMPVSLELPEEVNEPDTIQNRPFF